MIIILFTILWCIYASIEGYREARHFFYRVASTNEDNHNEHKTFALQRIVVWLPFEYIKLDTSNYLTILNGVCLLFMFTFWHDGFYYWKRNKLDNRYPMGFWSQSVTSTSWMDRKELTKPIYRIIGFVAGAIGLVIINYL